MNKDKVFFILQALIKNIAFDWGANLRSFVYRPFFKRLGKDVQIKDGVVFKYPSEIEIGDHCKVGEYCYFVGKSGLKIGNYALIGAGTKIITSSHNSGDLTIPMALQGLDFSPVYIGDNVWFGFDVKILAGSVIASGSIVGTSAVVNGIFNEENCIIAGIPAEVKKKRIHKKEIHD